MANSRRFDLFRGKSARRLYGALAALLIAAAPGTAAWCQEGGGVARATLENGLKVVIVPDPLAPVVTTVMNYHVGSNEAPPGFPGTAHALEHMMFRGSPGLSAQQISAIAAAMGGDFDADTQQDVTQYFFTVPKQYLAVALHVQSVRMSGLDADEAGWKKERGAIEQEVARDLSSPQYVAYTKVLKRMFQGTPYAHDALGTRASFDKTTAAALKRFYRTWYAPNNATLVIAGDVDPQQALDQVKHLFGGLKPSRLPERPAFSLGSVKPDSFTMPTDQAHGTAMVTFRMPGFRDADFEAAEVLAQALDSTRSPLYNRLVPTGKAMSTGVQLQGMRPGSIGFVYATFPRGGNADALRAQVKSVLKDIAEHGVSEDLVTAAKRQAETQFEQSRESIYGLAMQWSQALVVERRDSPRDELRAIEKVTAKDVARVARRYLGDDHAVDVTLVPTSSAAPSAGGGFGGKESFAPTHARAVKLPPWAAGPLADIQPPAFPVKPSVTTLDNGLRLIVQPESVSHVVHVYGRLRGRPEMQVPPHQEGVDSLLEDLLNYGTESMDRTAFQRALDDIGADESAGRDFSLTVLSSHLDRGLELLADNELHPALPEAALRVLRQQHARAVAGQLQSPGFHLRQQVISAIYPKDDPILRHATPKTVSGLTRKDVVAYYHKVYRPDLATLVVVGDITPQRAKALVEKHFGGWKANGPKPATVLPPVPLNSSRTVHVPDSARSQDRVVLAETLGITRSSPGYYALNLGNQVLSGGFYTSRLYRILRAQRGLVYSVGSAVDAHETRAVFEVFYGSDPANVSQAHDVIADQLLRMRKEPVSDAELHQARAQLVRQVPLSLASVSDIGQGLLQRANQDLPLDEPLRAAKRYLELNAKDVQAAYRTWVRPEDLVQVVEGPAPH